MQWTTHTISSNFLSFNDNNHNAKNVCSHSHGLLFPRKIPCCKTCSRYQGFLLFNFFSTKNSWLTIQFGRKNLSPNTKFEIPRNRRAEKKMFRWNIIKRMCTGKQGKLSIEPHNIIAPNYTFFSQLYKNHHSLENWDERKKSCVISACRF